MTERNTTTRNSRVENKRANGNAVKQAQPDVATARKSGGDAKELLISFYKEMVFIRNFELKASEMYQKARIGGYCHLNLGEEATVVGLMKAMHPDDYLFTTYREHGYALSKGSDPGKVMAELFGKADGISHGWGGSMHLFDKETHLMGGYGIVGGQIPPATGAALAISYKNKPSDQSPIVVCIMGDGTTNIGAFHESLNIAAVWKLPIVYVIVNNLLGMGTSVEMASGEPELYKRGASYRIQGIRIDGEDPLEVYNKSSEMFQIAREEYRPVIIEALSHRLKGHSVVDPAKYRSEDEVKEAEQHDPIPKVEQQLLDMGYITKADIDAIAAEAKKRVQDAVTFAEQSPNPDLDKLFSNVYATKINGDLHRLPGEPLFNEHSFDEATEKLK
ncbi:MAG: pyruvate dehydrogenase (acetyl-transferring) E1 component subunit alpha [Firmicutes bacterium]|nr:pyruvate dehydrogenase (acetyl-transferring) E1 component subunit alpha [Bacillota bacterium]